MLKYFPSTYSNKSILFTASFFILFLYLLPYIYLGQDYPIMIHDNLDSNVASVKTLLNSGEYFAPPDKPIQQIFNGIPHSSILGSYSLSFVWFKIFGIFWGYVVNKFLMSLVGFIGMYHLLKKHFLPNDVLIFIPIGVALLFSVLPFWSFDMSVSGLPLTFFAFLNIRKGGKHFVNWLIIFFIPFYSSLIASGIFIIVIISFILIYDVIKTRKINKTFFLAIALFSSLYVISHYPLFYMFLFRSDIVSHRVEFGGATSSFLSACKSSVSIFLFGQGHAKSLHTFLIIPIIFALFKLYVNKIYNNKFISILIFLFITSIFYGFINYGPVSTFVKIITSIIPIQLQRFHWLHPTFWYILLGMSLNIIIKTTKHWKPIIFSVLLIQILYISTTNKVFREFGKKMVQYNSRAISFRQFYAENLFESIKNFIGDPVETYSVISIGLHPSIAQFNGFYTLDGYFPSYPLKYKHKFREVIEKELDKDDDLKEYFDYWGSRCYAFSTELGRDYLNPSPKIIEHLEFNYKVLKEMGGKYILSYAEIDTINNEDIKLLKMFENSDSYWQIYLYEIE